MAEDVVCDNCGAKNMGGSNFCNACGFEMMSDEPTTTNFIGVDADTAASPGVGQLVVTRGALAGARYDVSADETTIGRHPDSDIFLDDVTVSRRHARIASSSAGKAIEDVGSLNGTYVDGERLESATLREGAQIQIGKYRLVYVIGSEG